MTHLTASTQTISDALLHLSAHDPTMARLIQVHEPFAITPHQNYYQELVESIIGQQLSVKAAATIRARFRAMYGGRFPDAATIRNTDPNQLRSVGLSGAKVRYVQDLATRVDRNEIDFTAFDELSNDDIIAILTEVHGIGEWTAHMFLIFCMGRLNVLAHGDLGVRAAIMRLYNFSAMPRISEVTRIAAEHGWSPYESIACWYLWRSLDNA